MRKAAEALTLANESFMSTLPPGSCAARMMAVRTWKKEERRNKGMAGKKGSEQGGRDAREERARVQVCPLALPRPALPAKGGSPDERDQPAGGAAPPAAPTAQQGPAHLAGVVGPVGGGQQRFELDVSQLALQLRLQVLARPQVAHEGAAAGVVW